MPVSRQLRAVAEGEAPPPKRPMTVKLAAEEGSHWELLVALRSRVAIAVEDPNCPARDLAALSRRLQEINKEIVAIEAKAKQEEREDAAGDEEWDAEAL